MSKVPDFHDYSDYKEIFNKIFTYNDKIDINILDENIINQMLVDINTFSDYIENVDIEQLKTYRYKIDYNKSNLALYINYLCEYYNDELNLHKVSLLLYHWLHGQFLDGIILVFINIIKDYTNKLLDRGYKLTISDYIFAELNVDSKYINIEYINEESINEYELYEILDIVKKYIKNHWNLFYDSFQGNIIYNKQTKEYEYINLICEIYKININEIIQELYDDLKNNID